MGVIAENKLDTERCCVGFVGVGLTLVGFCERCKEWNEMGTEWIPREYEQTKSNKQEKNLRYDTPPIPLLPPPVGNLVEITNNVIRIKINHTSFVLPPMSHAVWYWEEQESRNIEFKRAAHIESRPGSVGLTEVTTPPPAHPSAAPRTSHPLTTPRENGTGSEC